MRLWAAAALAAYFLFFFRLTGTGLVGPDEPRYAWIGREMARSGDWVTPRLWGQPWFEKPALLYWTTAAAFKAGLGDDWAPRLPVATLSVLFLLFFFWRLRAELGNPAAGYATGVLATSAGWVAYSRVAVFDLPLSAVFGAAMLALLAWLERRQTRWLMSFTALLGLSVLAKGLVGPVLAALTLLCWSARNGLRELRSLLRPAALLVFLAVASPWYMLCYLRNGPPFLAEFFWRQHFARYAAGALAHNQPLWYFVPVLALGLLPWTPLLTAFGAKTLWRERKLFFFLAWAAVTVIFFSFSRDKLPAYILPALPAIAALAGVALARTRPMRIALPLCAAALALFPAAAGILPEALDSGARAALRTAPFPVRDMPVAAALAACVALFERTGRRQAAVAAVLAASVAGYIWIAQSSFRLIDQKAGARSLWRQIQGRRQDLCLDGVPRGVAYGLYYYAGRILPDCSAQPRPVHIRDREAVLHF